jgi:hypothetical protein
VKGQGVKLVSALVMAVICWQLHGCGKRQRAAALQLRVQIVQ